MKFQNTQVWGFEHAIRGMRNPKESWNKSQNCPFTFDYKKKKKKEEFIKANFKTVC